MRPYRLMRALALFAVCLFSFSSPCVAQTQKLIRVNILNDASSLMLGIEGEYEVRDSENQNIISQGKGLKTTVTVYKNGFSMGKVNCDSRRLVIRAKQSDEISIDGRRFRGAIQFNYKDAGHFLVVNYLPLEDYIKGVLFHESSHYWPDAILKAQAIVCRTFALFQMQQNSKNEYDVTNDIYSQMYGGSTSERYRTNRVVLETRGQVLTYNGKIMPAYFHATCAGHTEDAALLWNVDMAPLKGVACDLCKDSPHYRWHETIPQDDFRWSLRKAGYRIKKITKIEIAGLDASGRITELKLFDNDTDIKISAKDLRNTIGPNVIKSTNFKVSVAGDDILFEGLGWGHGVGMCQWGGYFMAKEGRSYQEILRYYYPGSAITQMEK